MLVLTEALIGTGSRVHHRLHRNGQLSANQVEPRPLIPLNCLYMLALGSIRAGDHVALIFKTRDEQFRYVCPFISDGLEKNERVLYIAHDNSIPSVLSRLANYGIDTQAAQHRGALQVLTREQSYLRYGIFEPRKMIQDLKAEVDRALQDGFTGLRASGEMTWALDLPEALAQVREYELELHRHFGPRLTGLCQYDQTRFEPEILSDVIRIHPKLIANGRLTENPFHRTPDQLLQTTWPAVSVSHLPGGV